MTSRTLPAAAASCLLAIAAARSHRSPLAMTLSAPLRASAPAEGAYGLRPADLADAYFPGEKAEAPDAQTIALVDAYNDPEAEADLNSYSREFKLPKLSRCARAATNDCFEQVNQRGETANLPFPESEAARGAELEVCIDPEASESTRQAACENVAEADGWALEMATDIETSHAVCQNCRILVVEARSPEYPDLEEAENTAARLGASEISNSWTGPEPISDSA